jgi:hypothetical protein
MGLGPLEELKELRMDGRLSSGELEDFDLPFAFDYAIHPLFKVIDRDTVDLPRDWRVSEAGGACEVAAIDDLDQGEAG